MSATTVGPTTSTSTGAQRQGRNAVSEWLARSEYDPRIRLCVGVEEGFSGARPVRLRLRSRPEIALCETLAGTCAVVAELALGRGEAKAEAALLA